MKLQITFSVYKRKLVPKMPPLSKVNFRTKLQPKLHKFNLGAVEIEAISRLYFAD